MCKNRCRIGTESLERERKLVIKINGDGWSNGARIWIWTAAPAEAINQKVTELSLYGIKSSFDTIRIHHEILKSS